MLKNILNIVNRDGYISRSRIAAELNTTKEVIDQGIHQLLKMEYLLEENTGADCSTICAKCPFANNCSKEIVRTFKILNKGGKYIKRQEGKQ